MRAENRNFSFIELRNFRDINIDGLKTILLIGLGSVSGYFIDFFTRLESDVKICIASRNINKVIAKVNEVKISNAIMGIYPLIEGEKIDLNDAEEAANIIKKINPDVIINCTVKNSPHSAINNVTFPNNLGYGHFIMWQADLAIKFMKAVKFAGQEDKFIINTSYGDAVNWLLKTLGYKVNIGIGNINHIIPRLKMAIADTMKVKMEDIFIKFVGGHYLDLSICYSGTTYGCPYNCQVFINDCDVTKQLDFLDLFIRCNMPLVEIAKTEYVSEMDVNFIVEFFVSIGKVPVIIKKPILGYIGNRLQFAMLREAVSIYNNDVATLENIDTVIKYGFGLRLAIMGLFETVVCGGSKTFYDISNNIFKELSNETRIVDPMAELMKNDAIYKDLDKEAMIIKRDLFLNQMIDYNGIKCVE